LPQRRRYVLAHPFCHLGVVGLDHGRILHRAQPGIGPTRRFRPRYEDLR
jgi:hypothetical protein